MSLEKLVQQIQQDAEQEASQVIAEAKEQADHIITRAKEQAKKDAQEIASHGEKEGRRSREKTLAAARRTVREQEMKVKEEVMQDCLAQVHELLQQVTDAPYKKTVQAAIEEGRQAFGDCVVLVSRNEDKKIAQKMNVEVAGQIESTGGVAVQSADGSRHINRTFEAIMERKMGELRMAMAEHLFPKEA